MIKMVNVVSCKCEKCDKVTDSNDKFCSECGNTLLLEITYEEVPKIATR